MQLVVINDFENNRQLVNGRELYDFLEIDSNYTTWIKRMFEYGFEEMQDFIPFLEESSGGRPKEDHQLTIDMAKEIAMLQRSDKGKQARKYFIELEKAWNCPEMITKRAMEYLDKQIAIKQSRIELLEPKAIFADAVASSENSILVRELATVLKQNGVDIGEKRLFAWLRDYGYLIKKHGHDYNKPTQKSLNLKVMEVKATAITRSSGVHTSYTPKITGKGQVYFTNKLLES